jgi:hypothetical protein
LFAVGTISFFLTQWYYTATQRTERANAYEHVIDVNTGSNSANLIYSYNTQSSKVSAIVLELFESDTHNLDYITIPHTTEVEIPSELYTEMMTVSKEIPQIAKVGNIRSYFTGDVAFEYGILLLEEAMGIDIGYFTALPSDMFKEYFENIGTNANPCYKPSAALASQIGEKTSDGIYSFLESIWDRLISDTTLAARKKYTESFAQINPDFIYTHRVKAQVVKNGRTKTHIIDKDSAYKLVHRLVYQDPYKKAQNQLTEKKKGKSGKSGSKQVSSIGKSIQITNASQINGLAASYQEELGSKGYTILGIGDYSGEIQSETTILVKDESYGKDLLEFFPEATIEKSSMLTGDADIEVILGINADR